MSEPSMRPRRKYAGRIRRGVIGVFERGPRLLLVCRAAGVARGGFWCFPGGHLERGETSRMAIVRELQEELSVNVRPTERVGSVRLAETGYVLAVWRIAYRGEALRPSEAEIADYRWLTPDEIRKIKPALPSNERVLEMLDV